MLNSTPPTSGTTENLFETVKQWLTETGSVIEEMDLVDEAAALRPDTGIAVAFLERLRPGGPWLLTAIVPDGGLPTTVTARTAEQVEVFICQHNGKRNLYYSVNPTRIVLTKKASKVDIAAIEYLPGDLDPKPDETTEAAKARYLAALKGHEPKPAAIIDSGNGINILLKLAQRIELPGPVVFVNKKTGAERDGYEKEALALIADAESRAKALMEKLGSVAGTQNIDRILRLPGTINLPNAKKRADGRVPCPARLIEFSGAVCKPEDFPAPLPPKPKTTVTSSAAIDNEDDITLDWAKVYQHAGWLKSIKDLPPKFNAKARTIIEHKGTLDDLNRKLAQAKPYASWSEVSFALAAMFKIDGRLSHEKIAAALMCDLECNYHITKMDTDRSTQERAIERLLRRAGVRPTVEGGLPVIKYGPLSKMADQAAAALIGAKVAFYQRGNKLVRPVVQPVQSFGGTSTMAAQLVEVDLPYLRDTLCRHSHWIKWNMIAKKWLPAHPHKEASLGLLKKFGDWTFPTLAGIITTPTLRPDGSILKDAGYDPATQLLLIDPPAMPDIPDKPTKDDALAALKLLKELLAEFVFVDDDGVSLAVALSAQISAVCRGAYSLVPMHIGDAPAAGSGKSYLLNTVSWIATGQAMPTMGAGKDEAELGKRLDAAVIAGQQLVCIDNVVGEIGGETICRLTEQPRPQVRILGVSRLVTVDARSVTFYGNGNNVIVVGDLCRRVVTYRLDARTEHPELREFKHNPMKMILANRGDYIAACLTICRAYAAAGRPNRLPQLASYGEWSDTVRSALVWLGEADPVKSQGKAHADDPEASALLTVLNEWKGVVGAGEANARAVRDVIVLCDKNSTNANGWKEYDHNGLRQAVLAVMPVLHRLKPDATALGYWLRSKKERRIGGLRFRNKAETGHNPALWWVEAE